MSQSQSSGTSAADSSAGAVFSQRIVFVDTYTSFPIPQVDPLYSTFRGAEVKRVPVIRIYGSTQHGRKTCTHVHGVFPYLYIKDVPEVIDDQLQRLALAVDRGINSSLGGGNTESVQHVFRIAKVHGRTFYGYRKENEEFLKIQFYSPLALSKATDLLQSGKVLNHRFQPYETHIPYTLQFLMDFKLYGMNFIHFSGMKFRGTPILRNQANSGTPVRVGTKFWDVGEPPDPDHTFLSSAVVKKTRCELEIDVTASEIIVSESVSGKNPGIEAIWNDERERRRLHGLVDWAQVSIPDSQARPLQSYIFKREAELMDVLRGQLQEASVTVSGPSSPSSQESKILSSPSSQLFIERLEEADSAEVLSWNKYDEEMVSLLEDMAREREQEPATDSYDMDSILGSQGLEEDPYIQATQEEMAEGMEVHENGASMPTAEIHDSDNEEDSCWTQSFLSDSMLVAAVEESERRSLQGPGGRGGFMIDQVDGQCDGSSDSGSDDSQIPGTPPENLPLRRARVDTSPNVPVPLGRSGSSDDDVQFICAVKSPTPPRRRVRTNRARARPRIIAPDSPVIHDSSSSNNESTEMVSEVVCPEDPVPEITIVTPPPVDIPVIDVSDDEKESGKTSQVDGNGTEMDVDIPVNVELDEETQDNGIESFYVYPGTTPTQPQLRIDDDEEEHDQDQPRSEEPQEPSSQQSIQSFYKYSSDEENPLEVNQESESEAEVGISSDLALSHTSDDLDSSEDDTMNFQQKNDLMKRQMRARAAEKISYFNVPYFDYEVAPLRRVPPDFQVFMDLKRDPSGKSVTSIEPLCFQYCREMKRLDPADRGKSEARQSTIQDMLQMTRALKEFEIQNGDAEPDPVPRNFIFPAPLPVKNNEDTDSDDDVPGPVKPFGFGRFDNDSEGGESLSDMSDNDNDTVVPSPASSHNQSNSEPPSPMPMSSSSQESGRRTPKSLFKNPRRVSKKRRLTWGDQYDSSQPSPSPSTKVRKISDGHYPQIRLNESELDSVYFSSQSPAAAGALDTSNFQNAKALHECQFLTTLSMEILCSARNTLTPDPQHDAILAIYYTIHRDNPERSDDSVFGCFQMDRNIVKGKNVKIGKSPTSAHHSKSSTDSGTISGADDIQYCVSEVALILKFVAFVQETDPDILAGYEILKSSWGYLIERGTRLGLQMTAELSRLLPLPQLGFGDKNRAENGPWNESISGRIVINLWRLLRHEITVTSYTFENAVFQILHERTHLWTYRVLQDYFESQDKETQAKVTAYFRTRVEYVIRIIEKLDLINRTSELARLFGIQFFEVLSRGSQFRVESMMLRLAKPANLIPPSPNPMQRGSMKAPEYLPLIMEPESKFYTDPVAVLDFQSLYPSMMMAYNYCFSTCVGRVQHMGEEGTFQLGCLSQQISPAEVANLLANDLLHISPCGVVFVKSGVRKGILGEMLEQILDTRQMVKRSMKKWKDDVTLQKVLDSRQLGLKLIANVTYGYTSANFSGRMPCVDIADSVVSKGRETLQRAIDYVKENEALFEAKVVYGDTDSLFLHFPGKTRAEAFVIAQRIVDDVTAMNPKPVKLKLEKVYQPCILQTKKRYVGFSYETPEQAEPKYEAKGIETVRRDGCPATAKILEGALKTLFVTLDGDAVRKYLQEQFRKIFMGRVSLIKYIFAREYRGRDGYKPTAVVPALEISKKLSEKDPRSEPLPNQRVPYIVVYGNPGLPLIQLVRRPAELIGNHNLRLNAHYYIEKAIIPALHRCFALAGFNVGKWYSEMPRKYLKSHYTEGTGKKGTIDQYFKSESCVKCESRTVTGLCDSCFSTTHEALEYLRDQEKSIMDKYENTCIECRRCSGEADMICVNMDCPVKHRFLRYERDYLTKLPNIQKLSRKINTVDW